MRISLVAYLNAAPLGWAFLHGPLKDRFEVIPASPARCADQLANGEVEIGIIPTIEYQRIPKLKIIPGIAIGSLTKVRSVILASHRGREIRSLAVDTSSRTSAVLVQLLLKGRFGISPDIVPHPPDPGGMLLKCDAALIIGDAALRVSPEDYEILDLAEAWIEWQGHPFVFAFWACRAGADLPKDLVATFHYAKRIGLEAREDIARQFSESLNLPAPFLLSYINENVNYDMTERHISGLEKFYQLAWQEGLIDEVSPLRFLQDSNWF